LASTAPKPPLLTDQQRLCWLRLIRSENIEPATFRALINQFGSAEASLPAIQQLSRRGGRANPIELYSHADAEAELAQAKRLGAHLVAPRARKATRLGWREWIRRPP
jgi:DNA processing protein